MCKCYFILAVGAVIYGSCDSGDHSGSRLVRAQADDEDQLLVLSTFLDHSEAKGVVDIWDRSPRHLGNDVTFSVPSSSLDSTVDWLEDHDIQYRMEPKDLQMLADEDRLRHLARRSISSTDGADQLDEYIDHDQINEYLHQVNSSCSICRLITIGQSYEGRDMDVIRIGRFGRSKTAIWIDAGIHAREWIAPATSLKIVQYLTDGYRDRDPDVLWMLSKYVWFILPSANPDGYMYTWTEDRYWRKTRSPNTMSECVGTDPNRNWNYYWGKAGTDPEPCSNIYPGARPFSEVETRNIRDFLIRRRHLFRVYLSFHAYGQLWMYSWGYDYAVPDNWRDLDRVGGRTVDAIHGVHGMNYTMGPIAHTIYPASGTSGDWAAGVATITYSYAIELRGVWGDEYGFLLPAEYIQPTSEEIWAGLKEMAKAVYENK